MNRVKWALLIGCFSHVLAYWLALRSSSSVSDATISPERIYNRKLAQSQLSVLPSATLVSSLYLQTIPELSVVPLPPDSPASDHPVERVTAQGKILAENIERTETGWQRTRLVKSPIKSRLLRVEEDWQWDAVSRSWVAYRRDLYLADQLIVKVQAGTAKADLEKSVDALGMKVNSVVAPDTYTLKLSEASLSAAPEAIKSIKTKLVGRIETAEEDGIGFGAGVPNDPSFTNQWALLNTGQSGGAIGADIGITNFWDILGNAPGVVIAVLDSGLNFTHPDLVGVAWTNPGEIPGDGIDNDGDGFIDDVNGWDFTNNDNDPTDDHGHGSNVSGIMVANRNDGVGMAGVIGGAKLMVCKVLDSSNSGTTSALISAVTYARQRGVPIMNMSLQNYPSNTTLSNEFNSCQTDGILLCICAGNLGLNNDVLKNYPSSFPQTNIIAVANHDRTDARWSGSPLPSSYGATNVDLFAPGREILGPILGTDYAYYTGTSQATPFVTAVAAAIKYVNPTWKAPQIKAAIMNTVVTNANYTGKCVTGGRLNAMGALSYAIRQQPTNDSDGDKNPNLLEYLAGTRIDDSSSTPTITQNQQGGILHLTMPRVFRTDAHLEIQRSTNLVDWGTTGVTDYSTSNFLDGGISTSVSTQGFMRVRGVTP